MTESNGPLRVAQRVETLNITQPWTCPICNTEVLTPFCSGCGERPPNARDLTLRGLFDQLVQAISDSADPVLQKPAAVRCSRGVFAPFLCISALALLRFIGAGCSTHIVRGYWVEFLSRRQNLVRFQPGS